MLTRLMKHLNDLGESLQQAAETSRRDAGRLQDENRIQGQPDTVLTFRQMIYGQWNYPKE
jgi:hypothetical protein